MKVQSGSRGIAVLFV